MSMGDEQHGQGTLIYKILTRSQWEEAQRLGVFTGAPVDREDGFIHFSNAEQVAQTAAKHFSGMAELFLAAVRAESLGADLRWEPSRGGALFPHLYRDLQVSEIIWCHPLPLGADGNHQFEGLVG
ncbi:MAG: DUF952 domain-containing protein [Neomegalonema sp.]|nr:DUF952 domain-containing protein [Neomegalonema sp.]